MWFPFSIHRAEELNCKVIQARHPDDVLGQVMRDQLGMDADSMTAVSSTRSIDEKANSR